MASSDDRDRIVDSAKYLREVRPIDPEELAEYVEGRTHPAVVAQVLRENATSLGLVERPDGTFVPVREEPIEQGLGAVRRLPAAYDRRIEELLVESFGAGWPDGASGDRLRERIRHLKEDYYRNRDVEYDRELALGYAIYHLGDFYAAVQYVLEELAAASLLDRRLRVLDVGAGVGGPALGLHDYLFGPPEPVGDETPATDRDRDTTNALVDYHAVEPSAAAGVLESLLDETGPNFHASVHRSTAEAFDPEEHAGEEGYDLILFASVLSELDDPTAVARRYLETLAPSGSLVGLAPADRETSTGLRSVERGLEADGATVFSPGVRLWHGRTPEDEGWSFDERAPIEPPAVQQALDEAAGDTGEFQKTAVRFSYSILRRDGRRRVEVDLNEGRRAPMADAENYVTERVDLAGIKLSRDIGEAGNPLFRVGDGSQRIDHYAVLARETSLNRTLRSAGYGDLLLFENVLALYNDDEDAYNLVVDEETVVDRAA